MKIIITENQNYLLRRLQQFIDIVESEIDEFENNNQSPWWCKGLNSSDILVREVCELSIEEFINYKETIILEVFCCIQGRYPRLNAIKNDDGTFTNRPFEDMDPFMDREEFKNEMIVKIV